jgi:EAL domain-containing protein (putative c-di-GMP-specific phosphodiesterase class I)
MSVNLSVEQFRDTGIVNDIRKTLAATGVRGEEIQLEITESVAVQDVDCILDRLNQLKSLGLSVSIDDFGTEYSSLSRLKLLPIDLLKIDMQFVRGITEQDGKDKAIVKTIIQLAKNLGASVLAEGVETEEQYLFLREQGCDEIQGYYFLQANARGEN